MGEHEARRRLALEEMTKGDLVDLAIRLQDQIREARTALRMAVDDGIALANSKNRSSEAPDRG